MIEQQPDKYSLYNHPELYRATHKADPARFRFYNAFIRACETHVLDLGCGTGDAGLYAAQHGIPSIGIDSSHAMLRKAKQRLSLTPSRLRHLASFIHGDIRRVPDEFLKGTFDTIICGNNTLMHMQDDHQLDACFTCAAKALRRGGFFIFDVLNPGALKIKHPTRPTKSFEDMSVLFKKETLSRKVWSTYYPQTLKYDHKIAYFNATPDGVADPTAEPKEVQLISQQYRYPSQIKLALEFAGLKICKIQGSFDQTGSSFSLERSEKIVIIATLD